MGERDHDDALGDAPHATDGRRRVLVVTALVAAVAVVGTALALGARDAGTAPPAAGGTTATGTALVTPSAGRSEPPSPAPGASTRAPDAGATAPAPGAPPGAGDAPVPVPPLGDVPPAVGTGTAPVAAGGLTVAVQAVEAVTTQAEGVGEVAGPGLAVTVEVRGPAGAPLDAAAVTAYAGPEGVPLRPAASDARNAPLPAELPADGVARSTYVVAAPAPGTPLAVTVLLRVDAPPVVVQGLTSP